MITAASFFFASLAGLALLFSLKAVEAKRGVTYAPGFRASADDFARAFKAQLIELRGFLARIPPLVVLLARVALHELALGAAKLARLAEAQSHRIADLVSHKRNFEKREPRSEFLKQVGDAKSSNGQTEDDSREI